MSTLQLSRVTLLRPVTIDDIAAIRHIHQAAFQSYSAEYHTAQEQAAFNDMVRRADYALEILNSHVSVAIIGGEIVGTAGWVGADERGAAARLRKVIVRPMFGGCGVGRMLVLDAERRAQRAGFSDFSVRASVSSIPFYKRLGYRITSHGVFATPSGVDLPITYMRKAQNRQTVGYH
ncbi:MAG: GNAT family N-acetyltransferase [Hyphomicrobiales bacterium]|nr:GNAT family N-acetyltransferase [Hyphomicrobiales bacterium]